MKRLKDTDGTRRIEVNVVMPGAGEPAVLNLVCGDKNHIGYLWIGEPHDGPCLGTVDETEARRLARAILKELKR